MLLGYLRIEILILLKFGPHFYGRISTARGRYVHSPDGRHPSLCVSNTNKWGQLIHRNTHVTTLMEVQIKIRNQL